MYCLDITDSSEEHAVAEFNPTLLAAVAAAVLICGLIIVFGCAEFCKKEVGFKVCGLERFQPLTSDDFDLRTVREDQNLPLF